MPKISYIVNQAPVICTTCPLRWRSAASDPDLILRALRIRILSGCVRGFSVPENGYLGSSHPSYALRARSANAPRLRIRIPPL